VCHLRAPIEPKLGTHSSGQTPITIELNPESLPEGLVTMIYCHAEGLAELKKTLPPAVIDECLRIMVRCVPEHHMGCSLLLLRPTQLDFGLPIRFSTTRRSDSPPAPPRIHPKCCSDPEIHLAWPNGCAGSGTLHVVFYYSTAKVCFGTL